MRPIALLALLMLVPFGCRKPDPAFAAVAEAIRSGAARLPGNGRQTLPARFAGLTPQDVVFVDIRRDGRTFVLFPTFLGKGSDVDGWLYCSETLTPSDYTCVNWGEGGVRQHLAVAGLDFLTVLSQRGHWYFVRRRVD